MRGFCQVCTSPRTTSSAASGVPGHFSLESRGAERGRGRACGKTLLRIRLSGEAFGSNLTAQFVEQRFGVLQVGGIEALGKPVVDYCEHRTRLVALASLSQQLCETHGGAQFV